MAVIETVGLSYIYKNSDSVEVTRIKNINISIERNEVIGIIGETGSGKSTLAQMLNGLIKPTNGKILLEGKNIWEDFKDIREVHFKVGLAFQYPEYQLFANSVFEDIAFGPLNQGLSSKEINERVWTAADFVGLTLDLLGESPFTLSGGQKRRVAIAGIIAMDPEVLILDEPTSGLDAEGRKRILNSIEIYHRKRNNVIIFISHVMEDIARICDKVIVLNKGELKMFDTPQNVFSNSDQLKGFGLDVPQITRIMNKVFNGKTSVISVEHATSMITSILNSKIQ